MKIKKDLALYGRRIAQGHLVMGTMGNISAKEGEKVWIKCGGAWLEKAKPKDFIAVEVKSGKAIGKGCPSKEVFLHLGCYKARKDVGAVVHTHAVMSTALATVGMRLCGAKILPYYPPGSKKLARKVKQAVKKHDVVMLANHGLVTVGKDIKQAYQRTLACERQAKRILRRLKGDFPD